MDRSARKIRFFDRIRMLPRIPESRRNENGRWVTGTFWNYLQSRLEFVQDGKAVAWIEQASLWALFDRDEDGQRAAVAKASNPLAIALGEFFFPQIDMGSRGNEDTWPT